MESLKRPVIIDAANVAYEYGKLSCSASARFDAHGILAAMEYFLIAGHKPIAIVQKSRVIGHNTLNSMPEDQELIIKMTDVNDKNSLICQDLIIVADWTKNRGDDEWVISTAQNSGGVILSGESYSSQTKEHPSWKEIVEKKLVKFKFTFKKKLRLLTLGNQMLCTKDDVEDYSRVLEEQMSAEENLEALSTIRQLLTITKTTKQNQSCSAKPDLVPKHEEGTFEKQQKQKEANKAKPAKPNVPNKSEVIQKLYGIETLRAGVHAEKMQPVYVSNDDKTNEHHMHNTNSEGRTRPKIEKGQSKTGKDEKQQICLRQNTKTDDVTNKEQPNMNEKMCEIQSESDNLKKSLNKNPQWEAKGKQEKQRHLQNLKIEMKEEQKQTKTQNAVINEEPQSGLIKGKQRQSQNQNPNIKEQRQQDKNIITNEEDKQVQNTSIGNKEDESHKKLTRDTQIQIQNWDNAQKVEKSKTQDHNMEKTDKGQTQGISRENQKHTQKKDSVEQRQLQNQNTRKVDEQKQAQFQNLMVGQPNLTSQFSGYCLPQQSSASSYPVPQFRLHAPLPPPPIHNPNYFHMNPFPVQPISIQSEFHRYRYPFPPQPNFSSMPSYNDFYFVHPQTINTECRKQQREPPKQNTLVEKKETVSEALKIETNDDEKLKITQTDDKEDKQPMEVSKTGLDEQQKEPLIPNTTELQPTIHKVVPQPNLKKGKKTSSRSKSVANTMFRSPRISITSPKSDIQVAQQSKPPQNSSISAIIVLHTTTNTYLWNPFKKLIKADIKLQCPVGVWVKYDINQEVQNLEMPTKKKCSVFYKEDKLMVTGQGITLKGFHIKPKNEVWSFDLGLMSAVNSIYSQNCDIVNYEATLKDLFLSQPNHYENENCKTGIWKVTCTRATSIFESQVKELPKMEQGYIDKTKEKFICKLTGESIELDRNIVADCIDVEGLCGAVCTEKNVIAIHKKMQAQVKAVVVKLNYGSQTTFWSKELGFVNTTTPEKVHTGQWYLISVELGMENQSVHQVLQVVKLDGVQHSLSQNKEKLEFRGQGIMLAKTTRSSKNPHKHAIWSPVLGLIRSPACFVQSKNIVDFKCEMSSEQIQNVNNHSFVTPWIAIEVHETQIKLDDFLRIPENKLFKSTGTIIGIKPYKIMEEKTGRILHISPINCCSMTSRECTLKLNQEYQLIYYESCTGLQCIFVN